MMTNRLKNKLGLYTLASGAMVAMANNQAEGQVVYNDVADATVNTAGATYMIDLNGDATDDFTLLLDNWGGGNVALYINPVGGAGEIVSTLGSTYKAVALGLNTTLKTNLSNPNLWGSSAMMAVNAASSYGAFKNVTDKYIGLRLIVGADYYYGWVRVDVDIANNTFTVKDMAYNSTVNTTIKTGQTSGTGTTTAVEQSQELDAKTVIFVNEQNEITVNNNTGNSLQLELMNVTGYKILNTEINNGSTVLSAKGLSSGVYLVKMAVGEAFVTKRIFIK